MVVRLPLEHQHPDELLARGAGESGRVRPALLRPRDGDARTEPDGDPGGVRQGARMDRAHVAQHLWRTRLEVESPVERLVRTAFPGALRLRRRPGLPARHGLPDGEGGLRVLDRPPQDAARWDGGRAERLVARARPDRGRGRSRPADRPGAVHVHGAHGGGSRHRPGIPRADRRAARPARRSESRPLGAVAGVDGGPRRPEGPASPYVAPFRGVSRQLDFLRAHAGVGEMLVQSHARVASGEWRKKRASALRPALDT